MRLVYLGCLLSLIGLMRIGQAAPNLVHQVIIQINPTFMLTILYFYIVLYLACATHEN